MAGIFNRAYDQANRILNGSGLSSIVYRAKGGKTKRKKKDKDFYADFDRKGKPTPELLNRMSINKLMEDLEWERIDDEVARQRGEETEEWERINKEVARKRREEAEQWEDMKFIQNAMKEDNIEGSQMFMPNQDLYDKPIFKDVITSRKGGGGLSNIKKSININGQPHKLAWINPDEASALRAMGGSGKKGPMGIPSYEEDESDYADASSGFSADPADVGDPTGGAGGADISYTDYELGGMGGYSPTQVQEFVKTASKSRATGDDDTGYMAGPKELTDMRKGILGLYGDRMTRGEALEGAKRSAFTTWRNTVGKYSTDTPKDYDEWFAKQDPNALIAGYKIGDPVGQAMQSSFDIVNKQLKKRFADELKHRSIVADPDEEVEMTREELSALVKDAEIEGLKDFKEYGGLNIPAWMPGGMAGKAVDFLSRTVIGTGTVGGVGVHLHKDGSVTPISPEDSPGFDHESMRGENVEAPRRRRPPPLAPPPEPLEKELTGMEKYIAELPKVSSREKSNLPLSALLDQIYGEGKGQSMLG